MFYITDILCLLLDEADSYVCIAIKFTFGASGIAARAP
jgi:hypothetical protein